MMLSLLAGCGASAPAEQPAADAPAADAPAADAPAAEVPAAPGRDTLNVSIAKVGFNCDGQAFDYVEDRRILFQIYVPLSLPAMATLAVFIVVGHWNSWFDGMLYMNSESKYPLQTYLQASLATNNNVRLMTKQLAMQRNAISDRTLRSAEIFIAAVPVLLIYPFLQRYFISGMTLGGVKE